MMDRIHASCVDTSTPIDMAQSIATQCTPISNPSLPYYYTKPLFCARNQHLNGVNSGSSAKQDNFFAMLLP